MKRFSQIICIVLVLVTVLSTTAFAAAPVEPRGSNYFAASSVYFWHVSGSQYQIWFDVTAKDTMTELGASEIRVERSTDLVNWEPAGTYYKSGNSQMTTKDPSVRYANYVTYYPTSGYAYRAVVTLYAKNSSGYGEMDEDTAILDLR